MSKSFEITVSHGFRIPKVYKSQDPRLVEEALLLGAYIQEHVHTQRATDEMKTVLEESQREWEVQMAEKDEELHAIQQELATLQTTLQTQRREWSEAQTTLRKEERRLVSLELERDMEALKSRCQVAEERKQALESSRDADMQRVEQQTRSLLQQTLAVREEQVRTSQSTLAQLQEAYHRQAEELKGLNDFLRRKITNVRVKGSEYESTFRDLLTRTFGLTEQFALTETARNGVGHAGDFLMKTGGNSILWELKDYDRPVPKQEVEKFQRDMKETKDVRVGVMISRGTEITGKVRQGDREVEFLEGKLLVYLSRFEFMGDEQTTLQSLFPLFRVWWELARDDEETDHLEETIRALEKVLEESVRKKTEWRVHRSRMEETLRWMSEMVEDTEEALRLTLKRIQTRHGVASLALPEGIFRDAVLDDKTHEMLCLLLDAFEPGEGETPLADMSDVLSKQKGISKETARKYILATLLDTAVVATKGKPTMIRGLVPKKEGP
jgi:hypothetical protein